MPAQHCSISIATVLEKFQSCAEPSMWPCGVENTHNQICRKLHILVTTAKSNSMWHNTLHELLCWYFTTFNTLSLRWNCHHFADDIFKFIFPYESVCVLTNVKISLKFIPLCTIGNKWSLVRVMTWRLIGDRPLPEPKMALITDEHMSSIQWRPDDV